MYLQCRHPFIYNSSVVIPRFVGGTPINMHQYCNAEIAKVSYAMVAYIILEGGGVCLTRFYIVRHGESLANASGVMQGWLDTPLSESGLEQARRLVAVLPHDVSILSSDLLRAQDTARAVQVGTQLLAWDARLREANVGMWQGQSKQDLHQDSAWHRYQTHPDQFVFPGGERLLDVSERIAAVMDAVGEDMILVSHRLAIRTFLCRITGNWSQLHQIPVPNASITRINRKRGRYTIEIVGWTP